MSLSRRLVASALALGPRVLPFADAASAELPLSRLLRLSLFQVSVGMALALLVGTLNRVLIVELGVAAGLVASMIALPVLYAPVRALVGFRSDHHRSALGWRRVPYIWMGTLMQFGGLAFMPFALLVLAGKGDAGSWPAWVGPFGAAAAFLMAGAGLHTTQTAGLALATDLARPEARPKVVGLMYSMLLVGTILAALAFGWVLTPFSPGRLVQAIQAAAVMTLVLNTLALWKQEARRPPHRMSAAERALLEDDPDFLSAWRHYLATPGTRRTLLVIGLGTFGFGMQDVLLEPYGGEVLGLSVGQTTWLTALLAFGGLVGFSVASVVLTRGVKALTAVAAGAAVGAAAFACVLLAPGAGSACGIVFAIGALGIGCGGGLFGHGTLTLTMQQAPPAEAGLALGTWGAVQATAAGVAVACGGLLRDAAAALTHAGWLGDLPDRLIVGYGVVYALELLLLVAVLFAVGRLRHVPTPTSAVPPLASSSAIGR
jgi:BCD family chlorophyll transporter-like MFS transporter